MTTKYVKLGTNPFYRAFMTYKIKVSDRIIQVTDDKAIAYANFRSYCRNYDNKPLHIQLLDDEQILSSKPAGLQLLDDNDVFNANDILRSVMQQLDVDLYCLKLLIKDSEFDISSSRIDGWTRAIHDRKFVQMHHDELVVVLGLLLAKAQGNIKNPDNIKSLRKKLGLTQGELAQQLGLKSGFRQVARWESGDQEMPDTRWKKMQELLK